MPKQKVQKNEGKKLKPSIYMNRNLQAIFVRETFRKVSEVKL